MFKYLYLFISLLFCCSHGHCDTEVFGESYQFVESVQNFYKINYTHTSWQDAKEACDSEGATLFYPVNEAEFTAVASLVTDAQHVFGIWIGIFTLPTERVFKTIDDLPLADVYDRWDLFEPNGSDDHEDCVLLSDVGYLSDWPCSTPFPFICKKTLASLEFSEPCGMGIPGNPGVPGPKGEQGPPGAPGEPGVCPTTCPVIYIQEDIIYAEGIKPDVGSEDHPSSAICKFVPASEEEGPAPDPYWVMNEEKFPVKCDKDTNRTCLILSHNDTKWINENKVSVGNTSSGMWLSESGFSLSRFNTISQSQLNFLKEQSMTVIQKVRVFFMHTTFEDLQLRMLNAYDVPIDQKPSAFTPMYYIVEKRDNDFVEVKCETWKYVDLVIINDAKRLPVVDFYVKHEGVGQEDSYISVQLRELCFG